MNGCVEDPNEPKIASDLLKYTHLQLQYGQKITLKAMESDGIDASRLNEIVTYIDQKAAYDKEKYGIEIKPRSPQAAFAKPIEPKMPEGLEGICKIYKMFRGDEDKCMNRMRQDGIPLERFEVNLKKKDKSKIY